MQLVPHLWFDTQAKEAAQKYIELFGQGKINWTYTITDTPSGDAELIEFELANLTIAAISAGPYFSLNESMSFMVYCQSKDQVEHLFRALSDNGRVLMPLDQYPFSDYYAWVADEYGLNWQLFYKEDLTSNYHLDINFLFDQEQLGQALPALEFYQSVFPQTTIGHISYYDGSQPAQKAKINYGELIFPHFKLLAMDHGYGGKANFNEAFSLMVLCDTKEELDYYWNKLSYVPQAEQCGWCKDQFGVSWQVCPSLLMKAYNSLKPQQLKVLNDEVLQMKKLEFERIERLIKG